MICGGILVGGESRRMGRPKAVCRVGGRTLAEIAAAALAPHVEATFLLGAGPVAAPLSALPRLADPAGVAGPLAGLLAAFGARPESTWLVAACDQPNLGPEAIGWLLAQRAPGRAAVLARRSRSGVEPFPGLFTPSAVPLLLAVCAGNRSVQGLAARPEVATPWLPPALRPAWRNVNTPGELARADRGTTGGRDPGRGPRE